MFTTAAPDNEEPTPTPRAFAETIQMSATYNPGATLPQDIHSGVKRNIDNEDDIFGEERDPLQDTGGMASDLAAAISNRFDVAMAADDELVSAAAADSALLKNSVGQPEQVTSSKFSQTKQSQNMTEEKTLEKNQCKTDSIQQSVNANREDPGQSLTEDQKREVSGERP